jgi:hypothetical protein
MLLKKRARTSGRKFHIGGVVDGVPAAERQNALGNGREPGHVVWLWEVPQSSHSGITDLQIVIADAVDRGLDGGFIIVCRGIPSGEQQGGN